MIWAVSIPYIRFISIDYGLFSDAKFRYAIPHSYLTFAEASTKEQALAKGMEEAKNTVENVEIFLQYADAVLLPQQLLDQALLEERNAT